MHGKQFLQASVSIRCRRCSCWLDKTLTSSFSRTSPTTTPLLDLHPVVLCLSPRSLLPTLHYPHVINVVHLTNLSIRHITSTSPTALSSHCSPYRSQRAFRRVPGPSILLGTPGFKFPSSGRCLVDSSTKITIKSIFSYPEDTHHIQDSIHTQIFDPWVMAVPMVCLDSCLLLAFKSYSHKREIL